MKARVLLNLTNLMSISWINCWFKMFVFAGVMETLLDIHGCSIPSNQTMCLGIFRNFAFYGPGRTLLINDGNWAISVAIWLYPKFMSIRMIWRLCYMCADGLLNILFTSLESSHPLRVMLASSTLWAIMYYSSKVCIIILAELIYIFLDWYWVLF